MIFKQLTTKLILTQVICFVLLILTIETLLRAYLIPPNEVGGWGYNLSGYGDLLPNQNFIASDIPKLPYQLITNSVGLRTDHEISIEKPSQTQRILAVGDSLTFGPYVNNYQTYPDQLENYLKQKNYQVEVLNAGISGYTLQDELSYLNEKGLKLKPDIIILGIYENDVADYLPSTRKIFARDLQKENALKLSWFPQLLQQSTILSYSKKIIWQRQIQQIKQESKNERENIGNNVLLQRYLDDLNKLLDTINKNNVPVVFLFFPSFKQLNSSNYFPQSAIEEKISSRYLIIDLKKTFENYDSLADLYLLPVNRHLSVIGNDLVAKTVGQELIKNQLWQP